MRRRIATLKKITLLLIAVMLAAVSLCACSAKSQDTSQELPQLVIGYGEYRPYAYTNEDGYVAGLDVELAREACKRMGYKPVFKQIKWEYRDRYLKEDMVDCLWSCFSMDEREDDYAWAGPYMNSRQVVCVLEGSAIMKLSDLNGKRIGVKTSTRPEEIFLEHGDKRIPRVENVYCLTDAEELATALRNGYVDAVAGHVGMLRYFFESTGTPYRLLDEDLASALVGVAFAKDRDDSVCEDLDRVLDDMRKDGTTASILEAYGIDANSALEGVGDE